MKPKENTIKYFQCTNVTDSQVTTNDGGGGRVVVVVIASRAQPTGKKLFKTTASKDAMRLQQQLGKLSPHTLLSQQVLLFPHPIFYALRIFTPCGDKIKRKKLVPCGFDGV